MKIYSLARWSLFTITLFWVAVIASTHSFSAREQNPGMSKIAPWVLERTANGQEAEFLVVLDQQADLSGAEALTTKQEKGQFVRDALWKKAQETQGPLLSWLAERNIEHRAYYIVNLIWVKATSDVAFALAARPDVARVEGNPQVQNFPNPLPVDEVEAPLPQQDAPTAIEWGVNNVRAPEVWAQGFTGQGIVVGAADTGYRWDHTAIKNKYRGWNGVTANHDYNWHDSIHSGGGTCGPNATAPCDDNGHGTHTAGSVLGDDGGVNQVGVAPGAKWIGCRNMNQGVGTPATYIECFEFFLAPYPVTGTPAQGNPSLAPDITTNSWGCPPSEGCSATTLQAAVEAQRAAGIMPVVAAGNAGPSCSTVNDPPAIYDASYSIGAHSSTNAIASFSSRGPVTVDGSLRRKPDVTAPGVSVRSCSRTSTTSYSTFSGTSMATPHVAGVVALLWSAHPELRHNIDATENVLNETAVHVLAATSCGSDSGQTPNNTWGHGRIDAKAAVDKLAILGVVSRKTHGGAGTFDIPLPLSGTPGVEGRSSGGAHTIVVTFNNPVASGSAAVTEGSASGMTSNVSGNTMTINLTGVADVQRLTVSINGVTGNAGQTMASTAVTMKVLAGDTNGSGDVSSSDIGQVKSQTSNPVTASNFRTDVAVNGAINATDIGLVKSRSGANVP
jgi:subtilisin family serine protease